MSASCRLRGEAALDRVGWMTAADLGLLYLVGTGPTTISALNLRQKPCISVGSSASAAGDPGGARHWTGPGRLDDLRHRVEIGRIQDPRSRRRVHGDLLGRGRAGDHRGDRGCGQGASRPRARAALAAVAANASSASRRSNRSEVARLPLALVTRREPRALRQASPAGTCPSACRSPAGSTAAARARGDRPRRAHRRRPLGRARVVVLRRHEPHAVARASAASRDLRRGEVRAADVAHLALADELVERAERLLDRGLRVGRVQLVEVDAVGAEAAQRSPRSRCARTPRRAARRGRARPRAELRRDDDTVATPARAPPRNSSLSRVP